MNRNTLSVGIVGCGNIAGPYLRDLALHPQIQVVGVTDLNTERAQTLAAQHGCEAYPSLGALLADERIQLIINLTVHHAHKAVTEQALLAGKHVHSEKPLALTTQDAWGLVELANQKGLRLSASPFTWMGEAQQTAWKQIREGRLGTVRVVYAEVNWGRIETWHPAPQSFYDVGPLWDVGVYPLAMLTAMFGSARRVTSFAETLWPERRTLEGSTFPVQAPDFIVTLIEQESGPLVRLTSNFYVTQKGKQGGIEWHGDLGSLRLESWHMFNAAVEFAEYDKPFQPVPLVREPYPGLQWGRSLVDMADAIAGGRPHRATGEHAAHIVEIICAAEQSMQTHQPVPIQSSFTSPAPVEWAL